MPVNYFAYGSNMESTELLQYCPTARPLGRARLNGWAIAFSTYSNRRNGGVADIVRKEGSSIWGVLWELCDDELQQLHTKEGFQSGRARELNQYETVELTVQLDDDPNHTLSAFAYEVVNKSEEHIPPHMDYAAILMRGAEEFCLPEAYVIELKRLMGTPPI